jgi:hypothetical protein
MLWSCIIPICFCVKAVLYPLKAWDVEYLVCTQYVYTHGESNERTGSMILPRPLLWVSQFTDFNTGYTQQLYRGYSSILVDFSEPPPQKKVHDTTVIYWEVNLIDHSHEYACDPVLKPVIVRVGSRLWTGCANTLTYFPFFSYVVEWTKYPFLFLLLNIG